MFNIENFGFCEFAVLVYSMLHLLSAIGMHGKRKIGRWNAPWEFIAVTFWLLILYFGGFFE